MKDRQKFSVRAFGNDGRRKKNEGDLVHSETAVEDFNGSGDSVADPVHLDLSYTIPTYTVSRMAVNRKWKTDRKSVV